MSAYFEYFPVVNYNGTRVRDISRRNRLASNTLSNPFILLPYTVKEGERAEDIAYYYYGSVDYVWLVYLANNILDPYHQWPLSDQDFNNFIISKYQEQSSKTGYEVIAWAQNENSEENIVVDRGIEYTVYEYERILNENKREILLVDRKFLSRIDESFIELIRNGR